MTLFSMNIMAYKIFRFFFTYATYGTHKHKCIKIINHGIYVPLNFIFEIANKQVHNRLLCLPVICGK